MRIGELATLQHERDQTIRRIECLVRNRDAVDSWLAAVSALA